MVAHPAEYPWSSHRHNAVGQTDVLISEHDMYRRLRLDESTRQQAYRELFKTQIDDLKLEEIRFASNRDWVLGSDYLKQKIGE